MITNERAPSWGDELHPYSWARTLGGMMLAGALAAGGLSDSHASAVDRSR